MLEIFVGNKLLALPEGTEIVLEQRNNMLDIENMGSDIVWTFDVPSRANAEVLENTHYIYLNGHKKYACEARWNGTPLATGSLYVQQSTEDVVSCGITINEMSEGWGQRLLRENDMGNAIEIASSRDGHKAGWRRFLKSTLKEDSVVKFFLFANSEMYSDNTDFGSHVLYVDDGTGVAQASRISGLENEEVSSESNSPQYRSYVNRLFFDSEDNIIELSDGGNGTAGVSQGLKLFNNGIVSGEQNGYCFCPAIRLDYVIRKVFENSGYEVVGNFLKDERVKKLYVQSLKAMDGDELQYMIRNDVGVQLPRQVEPRRTTGISALDLHDAKRGVFNEMYVPVAPGTSSSVTFSVKSRLFLQYGNLNHAVDPVDDQLWNSAEEVYALVTMGSYESSHLAGKTLWVSRRYGKPGYVAGDLKTKSELGLGGSNIDSIMPFNDGVAVVKAGSSSENMQLLKNIRGFMPLTPTVGFEMEGYYDGSYVCNESQMYTEMASSGWFGIYLVKCKVSCNASGPDGTAERYYPGTTDSVTWKFSAPRYLQQISDMQIVSNLTLDYSKVSLNIFGNKFGYAENMPNVSNADFVKELCRMFGLNIYVDSNFRQVELSYAKDVMNCESIDITPYVLDKEAKRGTYEKKQYEVTFGSVRSGKEINERNLIADTLTEGTLPSAERNINKYSFVKASNAYYSAEHVKTDEEDEEDRSSGDYCSWRLAGGNNRPLVVGESEQENTTKVKCNILVPNMRNVDKAMSVMKYIMEVNKSGVSEMFDEEYDGEFDFVLTQYTGKLRIDIKEDPKDGEVAEAYIESANPTCYDEEGNVVQGRWNLSATGEQSVGEECLRPIYELLANNIPVTLRCLLPTDVAMQLYRLNLPQKENPQNQVRWVMYQSQRYLPERITYNFGSGDRVMVEIDAIRKF